MSGRCSRSMRLRSYIARKRLLGALAGRHLPFRHPALRHLRAFAEEELFHLFHQELLRAGIGHVQPVVVDEQHRLPLPQLPALFRYVLEDALAKLTRKRRAIPRPQLAPPPPAAAKPDYFLISSHERASSRTEVG